MRKAGTGSPMELCSDTAPTACTLRGVAMRLFSAKATSGLAHLECIGHNFTAKRRTTAKAFSDYGCVCPHEHVPPAQ